MICGSQVQGAAQAGIFIPGAIPLVDIMQLIAQNLLD
jgi:hypothetical protein